MPFSMPRHHLFANAAFPLIVAAMLVANLAGSAFAQKQATPLSGAVKMQHVVKGRVVDQSGKPIAGVNISNVMTDKLGKFEFQVRGQSYFRIDSVPSGYLKPIDAGQNRIELSDAKPGEPIVLPDIVVKKAMQVLGRVIDEEGNPVVGAKVLSEWISRQDPYSIRRTDRAISDTDGSFTLRSVERDVDVRLTARTDDMASVKELVMQFGADAKPVEIVLSEKVVAKCSVRVTDSAGQPVERAQIQMFSKTNSQTGNGFAGYSSRILPQELFLTNADGVFEFPEKLVRRYEYSIKVSADGFVIYDRAGIKIPTEGDLSIDDIVLKPTRSLKGSVVDSSGKPVAGVFVWSHGIETRERRSNRENPRPKGSFATSDQAGAFNLTGIHPDAMFVFASQAGSISAGAKIADDQPIKLTLRLTEESIKDPLSLTWQTSDDSIEALEEHLDFILEEQSSHRTESQMLDALLRVNSKLADEFIEFFSASSNKARGLAVRGRFEDALEVCKFQEAPILRVFALTECAQAKIEESQKIKFLKEAAVEVGNIEETSSRLEYASGVIDQLLDLGQVETAKSLVESNMPAALKMNNEGRNEYSKGWFAKAAVRVDYENAWNLIKDSKTSNNEPSRRFGRHCGNMAHELAAVDPERAEKLLLEMEDRDQNRYVPRIVCRMIKEHPEKALKILDELLPDPISVKSSRERNRLASSYATIATLIADSHPKKANQLIGQAIEAYSIDASSRYGLAASVSVLVGSIECDPILAETVFWKLLDEYANPNAVTYSADESRKVRARNASSVAVLLGLTGRFPEVQATAAERFYADFEGEGELSSSQTAMMHDNRVGFAAIAMHDPKQAVSWHKTFYGRVPENDRTRIPSPWSVMASTLSMDGKDFCDYMADSIAHQWIPGTED